MVASPNPASLRGATAPTSIPRIEASQARVVQDRPADPDCSTIPGIPELWAETLGDPEICIAVLDGPVDRAHPSFRGAHLTQVETLVSGQADQGPACQHGTHIASVIFGQHSGPVKGLAPQCRGVLIPVFESMDTEAFRSCSQLDLARALTQAMQHGAQVINVSGGQFSPSGTAYPLLASVVHDCAQRGILIVAAAGNEGCECLHVPAALASVLAVGAMDRHGEPLAFSNWGGPYQTQGILAPGEQILGAQPRSGVLRRTGTSSATAVVSGVAALLLSWQRQRGHRPNPPLVRAALLQSARGCNDQPLKDCRRLLAGRMNVNGAVSFLTQGMLAMSDSAPTQTDVVRQNPNDGEKSSCALPALPVQPGIPESLRPSAVQPSACGCQGAAGAPQLVYALGQIGYDLISEARLDSLVQRMASLVSVTRAERALAFDPTVLLAYLDKHPWDAPAVEWTLSIDDTPHYAIRPQGAFAAEAYHELRRFLRDRITEMTERVSVAGVLAGKATLLNGQVVPVIVPELRGMYSWTTAALAEKVVGPPPRAEASREDRDNHDKKTVAVRNFLDRLYHELRNLGVLPQDRAVNYAATNAFEMGTIFETVLKQELELDRVQVGRSPLCRPGSDCWDIETYFFDPKQPVQTVRRVYRFTVDVSDIVPVTVGPVRSWSTR